MPARGRRPSRLGRGLAPLLLCAAGAFAFVRDAGALDSLRKRITADFGDVPCMQRVVRAEDPIVHLEWTIEEEAEYPDPLPEGEVADGQRFQFLAINQQNAGELPEWLTLADIEAAKAAGDMVGMDLPTPDDDGVWELSPHWPDSTWLRITEDDARIEQTNAAAEAGVDWDTTGVPLGAYQVLGYTWDPDVNVTRFREGLFKVVDETDDVGAPALYIDPFASEGTQTFSEGEHMELSVCSDAAPGSTLRAYLTRPDPNARSNDDFEWTPALIHGVESVGSGDHVLQVEIPELGIGDEQESHRVRIDIEDPDGEVYTAIGPRVFLVSQGDGAPPPEDDETGGESAGEGSGAGGCSLGAPLPPSSLLGLTLLGLWRRRRA